MTLGTNTSVAAIVAVVLALAGCGSYAAPKTSPAQTARTSHPPVKKHRPVRGIPQHNGGDRDADNNGGPNDGDGGI